ncbi:serine protease, partial [Conexibacter sp. JD483]|uniref:S1 family peptidase n=1 Tax=Conexibacter sp. JD483 TaxID=3064471 RepID=UPI00287043E5
MNRTLRPTLLLALLTLLVIGSATPFLGGAAQAASRPRAQASVVGGTTAQAGVFSSVVFITAQTSAARATACSGTVIAPTVVLTAAHCVVDEATHTVRPTSAIVVTAGSLDRTSGAATEVGAARIAVHPDYDPGALSSDAAVIRLSSPLALAPVTLADGGDAALAAPGTAATFAGFGATSGTSTEASTRLLTAATTVLADDVCQRLLGANFVAAVTLCAVDAGRFAVSTCRGDSGGPLLTQRGDGAWVQLGITSWGSLGCNTRVPQAFTRVSAIAPWISSQLADAPAAGATSPGGIGDAGLATSGAPASATRRPGVATARYRGRT